MTHDPSLDRADKTTLGYLTCPECGEEVPVGARTQSTKGGLVIELSLADVYAHAWTHE